MKKFSIFNFQFSNNVSILKILKLDYWKLFRNWKLEIGNSDGALTIQVLLVGFIAIILAAGFVMWTDAYVRGVTRSRDNSQAFTIAEAGIEYYRWHLAHDHDDFQDGTGEEGPYVHAYYDKSGNLIGEFELAITPPANGTSIVTVQSNGRVAGDPSIEKIIRVRMGLPSLARYSVVANSDIRFGPGTQVYGQLHSNGGIRFDGVAYNVVTSAKTTYNDPDHSGVPEFGVHTHVSPTDPLPPENVPVRDDVFTVGREFPVPAVDFNGFTQDMATIKTQAQANGFYLGSGAMNTYGYEIVLKTNDTFDVYQVDSLVSVSQSCGSAQGWQGKWGTWSIQSRTLLSPNVPFPANGIIFVEDDLWISGQINTARLTIAAGRFPFQQNTNKSITVNNNLLYTNYDGQDAIALIAQENFNIGLVSADSLRIDAAVVAQVGRVGRFYYRSTCGTGYIRSSVTLYGMLASNQRYGFAYTDGTGYQTRVLVYDANLLYGPPPSFPLTGAQYDIISWDEVK